MLGNCSRGWSLKCRSGECEFAVDEIADSIEGGFFGEACGSGNGAIASVDLCAPVRSKTIGDLAEDDRGTDFPLGNIIGRRDIAVGEEDEEFRPSSLDLFEQLRPRSILAVTCRCSPSW